MIVAWFTLTKSNGYAWDLMFLCMKGWNLGKKTKYYWIIRVKITQLATQVMSLVITSITSSNYRISLQTSIISITVVLSYEVW